MLSEAALDQKWMLTAPVIIVVCADLARSGEAYGQRGMGLYAYQDTAAAVENILLSVAELGLASCWVGAFREEMAAKALKIKDHSTIRPVAMLPVGYPAETPPPTPRRPLEEITIYLD